MSPRSQQQAGISAQLSPLSLDAREGVDRMTIHIQINLFCCQLKTLSSSRTCSSARFKYSEMRLAFHEQPQPKQLAKYYIKVGTQPGCSY